MERSWYYSKDRTERHGPVTTEQLRTMLTQGAVPADALVWSEGMTDWTPLSEQDDFKNVLSSPSTPPPVPSLKISDGSDLIPANLFGWLRFVGVMSIIVGALYCITCVGILWGVLFIIGGTALLGARSALEGVTEVPPSFVPFLGRLNTFFLATGILYIIALVSTALLIVLYGGLIIATISSLQ